MMVLAEYSWYRVSTSECRREYPKYPSYVSTLRSPLFLRLMGL